MNGLHHNIEKRLHFGGDLLQKDRLHLFYESVFDRETNRELLQAEDIERPICLKGMFQIDDVPDYLNTILHKGHKNLRKKEVNTYEGSLIDLTKFENVTDYMHKVISAQRRATLRRCEKRLQLCINPVYKMYFGQIDKSEYDKVFTACHQMLLRRHQQKNTYWEELEFWQQRYNELYQLVQKKKASVFVIYHNQKPIAVYVNSIYRHILDIDVIAYDIDYSKFKLGFISLLRVIQWAFENDFALVDMSKGDFFYKERFRTSAYIFKKQLLYNTDNINNTIKAHWTFSKLLVVYKLLPVLKKLRIDKWYRGYVRKKKKGLFANVRYQRFTFRIEKNIVVPSEEQLVNIDLNNGRHDFLKESLFDFLFLNFEFYEDVLVRQSKKNTAEYYFLGKNASQKLTMVK